MECGNAPTNFYNALISQSFLTEAWLGLGNFEQVMACQRVNRFKNGEIVMRSTECTLAVRRLGLVSLLTVAAVSGCASKHEVAVGPFAALAPFSRTIAGSGDAVCWSVKRALLSLGYMLERSNEPGVLTWDAGLSARGEVERHVSTADYLL